MKKVKVKFIQLATSWGFGYNRGAEAELPATDQLAQAIGFGRVELLSSDAPKEFRKKIEETKEQLIAQSVQLADKTRNLKV